MTFEVGKPFIDLDYNVEALRRTMTNLCVLYVLGNASETTRQILGRFVSVRKTHHAFSMFMSVSPTHNVCSVVVSVDQHNVTFRENDFEDVGSWP